MPIVIDSLLERLAAKRPVFHSECDFQFALAWQIREEHPAARIRLERPVPDCDHTEFTDLLVHLDHETWAVELKYKLPQRSCPEVLVEGERFRLGDQGQSLVARCEYIKDVCRMEQLVAAQHATVGIAIMLTNDAGYWQPAKRDDQKDRAFRIHEGRILRGELGWPPEARTGDGRPTLSLRGQYTCAWQDYSIVQGSKFRALVTRVDGSMSDHNHMKTPN